MQETFVKYLQYERRYSRHTIQSYETDLSQLASFLLKEFELSDLSEANHSLIRSWIVNLVESGIQPKSINRKIASIRAYYKFLLKQGVITKDPTSKVKVLKTSKKLPQFVNEQDMNLLLDNCEFEEGFAGLRDRLVLELLYGTGIRLSELIELKSRDINHENGTIKVLGKRNKERIIPFAKNLGHLMRDFTVEKKKLFNTELESTLIVTDQGVKVYPMFIYRLVKKYLNLFTTIDKRSPHVLRHTFATHLLNKGAELNAVKDLLGHTSLAATQVYTHNSLEKLKKVFDQAHPKA
ncbi:tyrosine-type recombinase/integrase [Fulvivirga lutea]|uniref:Tyrosine recombinase XerC n=1 Tax=Fulvivirga lutea TaxID=2810512 RepID=A0A974WM51_9BACT|nr:tyrosine-type recombinase/integrase [Fulvivirga lutea]QSE97953.1 tyrosine-type recombinase/integrase [Fulvivirga lutea]